MSQDIERRLLEHNAGKSKFTSAFRPWEIVYTEEYETTEEAREREKYLKTASGRRFLNKILDSK
jgi:putative endonuclease